MIMAIMVIDETFLQAYRARKSKMSTNRDQGQVKYNDYGHNGNQQNGLWGWGWQQQHYLKVLRMQTGDIITTKKKDILTDAKTPITNMYFGIYEQAYYRRFGNCIKVEQTYTNHFQINSETYFYYTKEPGKK